MATQCFKDLLVWQKAHQWVIEVYKYSDKFPQKELYCLTSQLRKSAVSVPANISEGYKKKGKADKLRFMNIAQGSLEEAKYYLILAKDLGYGDSDGLSEAAELVGKLLQGYISGIFHRM